MKKLYIGACLLALMGLVYPQTAKTVKADELTIQLTIENTEVVNYLEATPAILAQSEVLYANWLKVQEVKKTPPKPKFNATGCSCVLYAKSQVNFSQSIGQAKNWPITSNVPQVGAVVITTESWMGHVGIVRAIGDGTITIQEGNYTPCKITTRTLSTTSPVIRGYWY